MFEADGEAPIAHLRQRLAIAFIADIERAATHIAQRRSSNVYKPREHPCFVKRQSPLKPFAAIADEQGAIIFEDLHAGKSAEKMRVRVQNDAAAEGQPADARGAQFDRHRLYINSRPLIGYLDILRRRWRACANKRQ